MLTHDPAKQSLWFALNISHVSCIKCSHFLDIAQLKSHTPFHADDDEEEDMEEAELSFKHQLPTGEMQSEQRCHAVS